MNSVMVQERSSVATTSEFDLGEIEHLAEFPGWLNTLVGAYPESWANEATYMVFLRKFSRYDDPVMEAAVDICVDDEAKFPSIATLMTYVERFAPQDLSAQFIKQMQRAGYQFVSDEDHVMTFEKVATGLQTTVIH